MLERVIIQPLVFIFSFAKRYFGYVAYLVDEVFLYGQTYILVTI